MYLEVILDDSPIAENILLIYSICTVQYHVVGIYAFRSFDHDFGVHFMCSLTNSRNIV